jgi:hypothetical protein
VAQTFGVGWYSGRRATYLLVTPGRVGLRKELREVSTGRSGAGARSSGAGARRSPSPSGGSGSYKKLGFNSSLESNRARNAALPNSACSVALTRFVRVFQFAERTPGNKEFIFRHTI